MKYFTIIAVIFSFLIIQTVIAENWKGSVARDYKNKYSKYVKDMTKILNQKASLSNNPQTWTCVRKAINKFNIMSPSVRAKIDSCVHQAGNRLVAQKCAKSVIDKVIVDSLKFTTC